MANLTKKEIIEKGYLTDVTIANSNLDVDDPKFKAAITNRFYYDMIYGEATIEEVEETTDIQEPTTDVEEIVDPIEPEAAVEEEVDPVEPEATVEEVEETVEE